MPNTDALEEAGPLPTKDVDVTCQHCGALRTVNVPDPLEPGVDIAWACQEDTEVNSQGERVVVGGCTEVGGVISGPPAAAVPPPPPLNWNPDSQTWEADPAYTYDANENRWVLA